MTRLNSVCSLITRYGVFADVGCDHGLVAKFVCDNGLADIVYATDISEGSIKKARQLLSDVENVRFLVGDGLVPFLGEGVVPDVAVISGMGGQTIMSILSGGVTVPTLILGAQKNAPLLRKFLISNGYEITADFMVEDKGKFYDIIKAERGLGGELDEIQLRFGKFYKDKNADLGKYLSWLSERMNGYKMTRENVRLAEMIREVEKWQR